MRTTKTKIRWGGNRAHAHLLPHGSTSEQAPRFGEWLFRERHSASPRFHGKREHHPGLFTIHAIQRSTCVVQRCVYVSACTRFCSNASWARTCPTCSRSISKRTIFTSSSFACGRRQRTEKTQKKRKKKKKPYCEPCPWQSSSLRWRLSDLLPLVRCGSLLSHQYAMRTA